MDYGHCTALATPRKIKYRNQPAVMIRIGATSRGQPKGRFRSLPGDAAAQCLRPMLSSLLHHVGARRAQLLHMFPQALHNPSFTRFYPRAQFFHIFGAGLPSVTPPTPFPFRPLPAAAGRIGRHRRLFLTGGRWRIRSGPGRFMHPRQTDHETHPEHHRRRLSQSAARSRHTFPLLC